MIFRTLAVLSIAIVCLLTFQNCSKGGFDVGEAQLSSHYQATLDCFASAQADACLYQKSVVQVAGSAVASDAANQYQSFGVKLIEQTNPAALTSPSFIVRSNTGNAVKTDGAWKFNYYTDADSFAQVSAYYYLTDFKNFFKKNTGLFYAENRAIKVTTDSSFSSWSASLNEINLEIQDDKIPAALDAGLVVNLLAHANINFASVGQSLSNQSTTTQSCYNKKGAYVPYACCKSVAGCGPALVSGQADYMTAVYFANVSTTIGESWASAPEGISICGVSRDVAKNAGLTAANAYAACSSLSSPGNIYTMGSLYASIWWEVRKKVSDKNNFDQFFMRHLETVRGDDTFSSILTKLQTLDTSNFGSKYFALLQTEFQRRGL